MTVKTLALAAARLGSTAWASAAAYDLGDIAGTGFNGVSGSFALGAAIDDTWTFSFTQPVDFSLLLGNAFSKPGFAIQSFAAVGSGPSVPPAGGHLQLTNYGNYQTLDAAGVVGAGSYAVHVTGTSQKAGTQYSFALDVTPVPELETYPLLLVGSGVVGVMARRRKAD